MNVILCHLLQIFFQIHLPFTFVMSYFHRGFFFFCCGGVVATLVILFFLYSFKLSYALELPCSRTIVFLICVNI